MQKFVSKKIIFSALGFVSIFFLVIAVLFKYFSKRDGDRFLRSAATQVEKVIVDANNDLNNTLILIEAEGMFNWNNFHTYLNLTRIGFPTYVFRNDTLVYWNSSQVPFAEINSSFESEFSFKSFPNGYYAVISKKFLTNTVIEYIPIKYVSQYESRYLNNDFLIDFIGSHLLRVSQSLNAGVWVKDPNGINLMRVSLISPVGHVLLSEFAVLASFFWLLALFFGIAYVYLNFNNKISNYGLHVIYWLAFIVAIRVLLFYSGSWFGINQLKLFDPMMFAVSNLNPSLGDLLLNALCMLLFLKLFFDIRHRIFSFLPTRISLLLYLLLLVLSINFLIIFGSDICKSLILDSNIEFAVASFFKLNFFSYAALIVVLLIISSVFLLLAILNDVVSVLPFKYFLACNVFFLSLVLAYWLFLNQDFLIYDLLFFIWILPFTFSRISNRVKLFIPKLSFWFLFLSLYYGFQIAFAEDLKSENQAVLIARKVYAPNDPLAEYLLFEAANHIHVDKSIAKSVRLGVSDSLIVNRIKMQHFTGYLERYGVVGYAVLKCVAPLADTLVSDSESLNNVVVSNNFNKKLGYSLRIPVVRNNLYIDTIVIEMVQKSIKPLSPLPNLFLESDWLVDLRNQFFSYAIYENRKLVLQSGRFPYTLNLNVLFANAKNDEYQVLDKEGFKHVVYSPKLDVQVVVSYPIANFFIRVSHASTIYAVFLFFFLLIKIVSWIVNGQFSFRNLYFKTRIELALIGSVLFVLILLGYITVQYTVIKNRANQQAEIQRKILHLTSTVQSNMKYTDQINSLSENQISYINQLASNNLTDLNLFDKKGRLLFSTQSKVFDRGVLNKLIPAKAFNEIVVKSRTIFIDKESIGYLNYLSSYMPLLGPDLNLIAIINLPAFDTEAQFEEDLNAFLGNLLNIYVLIIILVGFTAFWLSDKITQPLQWLTKLITETEQGVRNPQMPYKTQDEVGIMLATYYRMVEQLDKNAVALAKSEKETAWRDMARQVAHEIRNPLTPIKLSVQHLMRAWNEKSDKFDALMERVPKTMLDQIESLNRIAGEFSAFAQMPIGNRTPLNLYTILHDSVNLYVDTIDIGFVSLLENNSATILADEEQIPRVFNNLIKNAQQSADPNRKIKVAVQLMEENEYYLVSVADNGSGIPLDVQPRIFVPNFTTKSSGMGLGLAIVKKIMELNQGDISFESEVGVGTTFFMRFKKHN